jgi:putative endonuclease
MYYTYILKSLIVEKYYIGYTSNLEERLKYHNDGASKYTRSYKPYIIIHSESFENKTQAMKRENEIKSYKGGNAFKKLIISSLSA